MKSLKDFTMVSWLSQSLFVRPAENQSSLLTVSMVCSLRCLTSISLFLSFGSSNGRRPLPTPHKPPLFARTWGCRCENLFGFFLLFVWVGRLEDCVDYFFSFFPQRQLQFPSFLLRLCLCLILQAFQPTRSGYRYL